MSRATTLTAALVLAACDAPPPPGGEPVASASARGAGRVEIVPAPADGEIAPWVRTQLARGTAEGRQVLIYVGATWCEPCMRFHEAAEAGELDAVFPRLRLLEFDLDRDGARLAAAGCSSPYIPLFARPTPEGRCQSDGWVMGGVKGDQAVAQLEPRLAKLLASTP